MSYSTPLSADKDLSFDQSFDVKKRKAQIIFSVNIIYVGLIAIN